MSTSHVDVGALQQLFYQAISSRDGPSDYELFQIGEYTFVREGRHQLQRMLERRLKCPEMYSIQEVTNTLILIYNVLQGGSDPDFLNFCCRQAQHVKILEAYTRATQGGHIDSILMALQTAAFKLSRILESSGGTVTNAAVAYQNVLRPDPLSLNRDAPSISLYTGESSSPLVTLISTLGSPGQRSYLSLPNFPNEYQANHLGMGLGNQHSRSSLADNITVDTVLNLTEYVIKDERPFAEASGGYSSIWRGTYVKENSVEPVAIKLLRKLKDISDERLSKRLRREIRAWNHLSHPNISDFYGVVIYENDASQIGMVSPWYSKGNLTEYLEMFPDSDYLVLIKMIANGLTYLHSQDIIHGDIKSSNIMVDDNGILKLIDFGLAQVIDRYSRHTGDTTMSLESSYPWAAPELMTGDDISVRTVKSDVYAFASTCLEIMTGKRPYPHLNHFQIIKRVAYERKLPDPPQQGARLVPSGWLWALLQLCWSFYPGGRPTMSQLQEELSHFV